MDAFIEENNKKKALTLGFKELKKKISAEILRTSKLFDRSCNKALILGQDHVCLIMEILYTSLDEHNDLDLSELNSFGTTLSNLKLWDIPIYTVSESDTIMVAGNLGDLTENIGGLGYYVSKDKLKKLIDKLPKSSIFEQVNSEENNG